MRKNLQSPNVVFQPRVRRGLQRGIDRIANAVRPTLGPIPRVIAIDHTLRDRAPELLDNGALIARRVIELDDGEEDAGAMLLRHMLWRQHEQFGDGSATAAVIFQSLYRNGVRYIASGGSATGLRRALEDGMRVILDELSTMICPVAGKRQLAQIADSTCFDPAMAALLGEIFDIIGEHGRLDIRSGRGRNLEREYVDGMYWQSGILSRHLFTDRDQLTTRIETPAILLSDLDLDDPADLASVLERAIREGYSSLLIVANTFSDSVLAMLIANRERFPTIAVRVPGARATDQAEALEDLSALTGGRVLLRVAGDRLGRLNASDLGRARRAWADATFFGITGGKGHPRALRRHITALRVRFEQTEDRSARTALQERIGKLMGGSATLWVGGTSENEIRTRKDMAERASETLRGALRDGVLPGGGSCLLACRIALRERLAASDDADVRAAYHMLMAALEEPTRTIVGNAGFDGGTVLGLLQEHSTGYGFDVHGGRVVDMIDAGIWDVAAVQRGAVRAAISTAAVALTVDVLVHRKDRIKPATRP